MGCLILLVFAALSALAMRALGLRGPMLKLAGATLLFGCAGYALQGNPGLAGSPRGAKEQRPPVPVTNLRHAFYGNFAANEHWLIISESLARRGNSADAVGVLKAAVKEHPGDPQLWVGLGNALVDHAEVLTPAAEFAYRRAGELSPGYPAPPFFMGVAMLRSGRPEAALAIWQSVLASAPAEASWRPVVEDAVAALQPPASQPSA
ncbi:tetratricopeptide repeat protein [Sphingomonas sinipercae]|uniref:Tetratricopeptide repeat protein n=1 Tax=Sphingomonas sinipercae TaxID=2714944 RepID=A0A6G7ZNR8_9SPHN|nr:tetratricopeptide repeat protein [Sphingomonas sinipercae]QIL02550.1 tetratricopeptide repeat protein [Sphingomonas sinipercae]